MTRFVFFTLMLLAAFSVNMADEIPSSPKLPKEMPWDLKKLAEAPAFTWTDCKAPLKALLYEGLPYHGKPTHVFAYYATPEMVGATQPAPWPGVVLVHGGGGTAFREWVTLWAKRGYAAIAMDLAGSRPDDNSSKQRTRLPDGGPDQTDIEKFKCMDTEDVTDDWPYHAVANAILAHSLLRTMPQVDRDRTALTGISWGGYTTCLVASIDQRFKAAVPVYGCGFLNENSAWLKQFADLGPEKAARWVSLYDPSRYLPACCIPIFFVNGTNDFAYPLDSYMKSFNAVTNADKNIRLQVKMPHGHSAGWSPPEIGAFVDSKILGSAKLPTVSMPKWEGDSINAIVTEANVTSGNAFYAMGDGPINKLEWQPSGLLLGGTGGGAILTARIPREARAVFFVATTPSGLTVSSPVLLAPNPPAAK
jgi:dienelactone hydrolase